MGGDITRGWKGAHDRVYIPSSRSHPTPRRLFAFPIAEVNHPSVKKISRLPLSNPVSLLFDCVVAAQYLEQRLYLFQGGPPE
jgi:hypothetical protein